MCQWRFEWGGDVLNTNVSENRLKIARLLVTFWMQNGAHKKKVKGAGGEKGFCYKSCNRPHKKKHVSVTFWMKNCGFWATDFDAQQQDIVLCTWYQSSKSWFCNFWQEGFLKIIMLHQIDGNFDPDRNFFSYFSKNTFWATYFDAQQQDTVPCTQFQSSKSRFCNFWKKAFWKS